jgi:hypothetical protein
MPFELIVSSGAQAGLLFCTLYAWCGPAVEQQLVVTANLCVFMCLGSVNRVSLELREVYSRV